MTTANKITEAKKAFARDANFQKLKARFTPKRFKPVKRGGKK